MPEVGEVVAFTFVAKLTKVNQRQAWCIYDQQGNLTATIPKRLISLYMSGKLLTQLSDDDLEWHKVARKLASQANEKASKHRRKDPVWDARIAAMASSLRRRCTPAMRTPKASLKRQTWRQAVNSMRSTLAYERVKRERLQDDQAEWEKWIDSKRSGLRKRGKLQRQKRNRNSDKANA